MNQCMSATERRDQLLRIMEDMHPKAASQADFTGARVAKAAGISTVMLYRLVGPEFKTLRSQLPGSRHCPDEALRTLRIENADLRQRLREAKEQLRTTAIDELNEAMRLMERLEEENLQLRSENRLLRKRLQEGGHMILHAPAHDSTDRNLKMVSGENST
jgi:regulator of replication initiation timing